jgi:hypothetical protein
LLPDKAKQSTKLFMQKYLQDHVKQYRDMGSNFGPTTWRCPSSSNAVKQFYGKKDLLLKQSWFLITSGSI